MSDDVVIDQEDDSIDDESPVCGGAKASVENPQAGLPHGLPDAVPDAVKSLLAAPAVPLDPGLDDVLGVGRHPGTDPRQAPGWSAVEDRLGW